MGYGLLLKLGVAGVILGVAFFLGWRQNGLRLNKQIDELKLKLNTAELVAQSYEQAQQKLRARLDEQTEQIIHLQKEGEDAARRIQSLDEDYRNLDTEWSTKYNRLVLAPLPEDCELAVREAITRLQELIK